VQSGVRSLRHRDAIISLAARYKLPAVYSARDYASAGGLLSYRLDPIGHWRGAASYVDRILKSGKPADLPVQLSVKYETVLNMTTAKALGLDVPTSILLSADERNTATQEDWIADGGNGSKCEELALSISCPLYPH
jgi:putative tryptophan/tyrosine transport system substrate-binding protein